LDLDRTIIIAGLKIKAIRDAIREMARHDTNNDGWTVTSLADYMNISPTHAEWLSEILVEQKILERKPPPSWDKDPVSQIRYALGEYGTRFTLARMLKRIDRVKVDNIIAELLKRVAQINANPDLCYFVNEIRLFGSAIDGEAESFGDVDIAYDLGRRKRPSQYKDWHDWAHKRWKLTGRTHLNFVQQLYHADQEILRLFKGRNQYLSVHSFDDLVGIGADSVRLFILPEGQIEAEDGVSGEKLHQARMANAKERVEKKEQRAAEEPSTIGMKQSPEQIKRRMITAVQSLAFDLIRAIDEPSLPEALEQSITVAHERIQDYRELNMPDRIADVLRDTLSIDVIEQESKPEMFVFSEDRERMAKDCTDKTAAAHRQITHAVLQKLKGRVLSHSHYRQDESYTRIEQAIRLRREADSDGYEYWRTHPRIEFYSAGFLSDTAVSTLRNIAKGNSERLHKQAVNTLSKHDFIKPFRKKWRLTAKGERAIKYHAEKDAFHAKGKGDGELATAEL
jgi:predicted nucleotidyltransferase